MIGMIADWRSIANRCWQWKGYAGAQSCRDWKSWKPTTVAGELQPLKGHSFCFAQPHSSETVDKAIGQQLSFTLSHSIEGYLGSIRTGKGVHWSSRGRVDCLTKTKQKEQPGTYATIQPSTEVNGQVQVSEAGNRPSVDKASLRRHLIWFIWFDFEK